MKIGQTLYTIVPTDDGKPVTDSWVVRTIRGGKITAIWKTSFTWGKRTTKSGDYGWLSNIPAWCRRTWREGENPRGLFTTKRQAIADAIKTHTNDYFDTDEIGERYLAALKRMRP